ncbi:hypothetical protein VTK56DRAFT_1488 [Thermocarpiscus australiensis]
MFTNPGAAEFQGLQARTGQGAQSLAGALRSALGSTPQQHLSFMSLDREDELEKNLAELKNKRNLLENLFKDHHHDFEKEKAWLGSYEKTLEAVGRAMNDYKSCNRNDKNINHSSVAQLANAWEKAAAKYVPPSFCYTFPCSVIFSPLYPCCPIHIRKEEYGYSQLTSLVRLEPRTSGANFTRNLWGLNLLGD